MMIIMYKIVTKVVANRLSLDSHPSSTQVYKKGRSIHDNILAAMVGIEYAQLYMQKCVLLQLGLKKAYICIG